MVPRFIYKKKEFAIFDKLDVEQLPIALPKLP